MPPKTSKPSGGGTGRPLNSRIAVSRKRYAVLEPISKRRMQSFAYHHPMQDGCQTDMLIQKGLDNPQLSGNSNFYAPRNFCSLLFARQGAQSLGGPASVFRNHGIWIAF